MYDNVNDVTFWKERISKIRGTIAYCEDALSNDYVLEQWEYDDYIERLNKAYGRLNHAEQQLKIAIDRA